MAFKISGWNDFYEGYLARCFEQPADRSKKSDGWIVGWKTANETSESGRMMALCEDIRRGQDGTAIPCAHVIVEIL